MIPRVLKVNKINGKKIHCIFNTGEYRIVDLAKFVKDYDLESSKTLKELLSQENITSVVKDGTLSFPSIKKEITLTSGKVFQVDYDLDPIMLYKSSIIDEELDRNFQIGPQLRKARKSAGLTQEELAERVGTSKGYISRIENNRTDIALKTLRRIVEVGLEKRLAIID